MPPPASTPQTGSWPQIGVPGQWDQSWSAMFGNAPPQFMPPSIFPPENISASAPSNQSGKVSHSTSVSPLSAPGTNQISTPTSSSSSTPHPHDPHQDSHSIFISPSASTKSNSLSPNSSKSPVSRSMSPSTNSSNKIQKRTLNTLAARRYRQKRVDQVSSLEFSLKETENERDELKLKVARLEAEVGVLRGLVKGP